MSILNSRPVPPAESGRPDTRSEFFAMSFLQPVPNTVNGWITTFPFYERPGHVGFGSYGVSGFHISARFR